MIPAPFTLYEIVPAAWHMPLVAFSFAALLIGRMASQGIYYAKRNPASHPIYAKIGKHISDGISDTAVYFAGIASGIDLLLMLGISMTLRIVVQGAGVNWGIGHHFLRLDEEMWYAIRWDGETLFHLPKKAGWVRIPWTLAGLGILTWRMSALT